MSDLAWLVLALWVSVLLVGLPLGRHALTETPLFGLQAVLAIAGLSLTILYVSGLDTRAVAWAIAGASVVGTVVVAAGAAWLIADRPRVSLAGQEAEETDAALAGVEFSLYLVAACLSIPLALGTAHVIQ